VQFDPSNSGAGSYERSKEFSDPIELFFLSHGATISLSRRTDLHVLGDFPNSAIQGESNVNLVSRSNTFLPLMCGGLLKVHNIRTIHDYARVSLLCSVVLHGWLRIGETSTKRSVVQFTSNTE
jgi:hypothetical protein